MEEEVKVLSHQYADMLTEKINTALKQGFRRKGKLRLLALSSGVVMYIQLMVK